MTGQQPAPRTGLAANAPGPARVIQEPDDRLTPLRPLSKAPVLSWRNLWPRGEGDLPCVAELPHVATTTSGRAALLAALEQMKLPPGSSVLVPSYHCPTMVAPVLKAGLKPVYFPIGEDGLPQLAGFGAVNTGPVRAMFVAHYFGLPNSLKLVKQWCRERGISLVEDCAHSYFGQAGELPVGHWGDYATASLSKFFPVAEAGLLASAHHRLGPLKLQAAGLRAQFKGVLDVLEVSHRHGRLPGISHLLSPLFWLKRRGRPTPEAVPLAADLAHSPDPEQMMTACDMGRARQAPSVAALWLHSSLPRAGIVQRRRANYAAFAHGLAQAPGSRLLSPVLPAGAAPYVCPLWVDGPARAEAVYQRMRQERLPVFRWDQVWPGTPADSQDAGPRWNRQMLQLLCHQDLRPQDVAHVLAVTQRLLRTA